MNNIGILGDAVREGIVKMEQCIPSNDLLSSVLLKPINLATGAIGGILQLAVVAVLVIIGLVGLFRILAKKRASEDISQMGRAVAIVPLIIVAIMLVRIVIAQANQLC